MHTLTQIHAPHLVGLPAEAVAERALRAMGLRARADVTDPQDRPVQQQLTAGQRAAWAAPCPGLSTQSPGWQRCDSNRPLRSPIP